MMMQDLNAQDLRQRLAELLRFGAVGLTATICYFILSTTFFVVFGFTETFASLFAYLISGVVSYIGQCAFTFKKLLWERKSVIRFIIAFLLGLLISVVVVEITQSMSWSPIVGFAIVCIIIPILNYLLLKYWVF